MWKPTGVLNHGCILNSLGELFKKYPCLSHLSNLLSLPPPSAPRDSDSVDLGGALARHPHPEEEGGCRKEKRFQTDRGRTQEQVQEAEKLATHLTLGSHSNP